MTGIMTTSRFPEITDELLSAYLDNAVTTGERARIEQAVSEDATIAWRLATLRETVALLRALPVLNAPRAFVLTPEMMGQSRAEPAVATGVVTQSERPARRPPVRQPASQPGWWERLRDGWRAFWGGGSPVWRNALATSMAALLVLLVLPALLRDNPSNDFVAAPMMSQESAAAPASAAAEEIATDATLAEAAANATAKQVAAATAVVNNGEAVALAPMVESAAQEQAPLARVAEGEVAAPPDAEVVVAAAEVTVRTIPGARATEDVLSGVASAESAPAYAAAASAPSAPDVAAADSALLAAPAARVTTADVAAADAAPASLPTLATTDTSAASPEIATPIATIMPTATAAPTAAPTAAAIAEARPEARVIVTAPGTGATMPTPPTANNAWTQLLPWLQLTALVGVIGFGLLWWRSRRT
jgi:anti-sigma factor RsiW